MPFEVGTTAQRQALPKPEILATPLDTSVIESCVLAASAVSADSSGPYTGRRYLLAGTVLAKRDDGLYIPYAAGAGLFDEVQKVTVAATGGTFKLKFSGQETATIVFNASTTVVKEKLEALSNIGEGEVTVTGTPGNYNIAFAGTLADKNQPQMTIDTSALTGEGVTGTVETVTEGGQKIAGILFDTVEFADATPGSNEPAAYVRRLCSFDKNRIVNFGSLEADLLTWGNTANVQCEFVNVTNAQEQK